MEAEILEVETSVALTAVDRASIDSQVATAKAHPRSVTEAKREAMSLATLDAETAESMFYTLKRKENNKVKLISGPSVRLAEILSYSWRNLRVDADIVGTDATHITAMGTCFDLERNVAVRVRVKRRITTKEGRRYSDDMIGTTGNAAVSIALRNAVVRVIPRVFVDQIYEAAQKAALGKGTITERRQKAFSWFIKQGASEEQIFALLSVKGMDDVGDEQLLALTGFRNAIKDGETTLAELIDPKPDDSAAADLNARFAKKEPAAKKPDTTPEPGTKKFREMVDAADEALRGDVADFQPELE